MSTDETGRENKIFVDAQMKPVIERMNAVAAERGPIGSVPATMMRERFNEDVKGWNEDLPILDNISDRLCASSAGPIPVRLYDPDSSAALLPCLIFIHGGGWIVGDLDTNERSLRMLAKLSGVRILSVDYPLAPESKFPIGLNACVAVAHWVRENGAGWGLDTNRLAVGGDSAGGNLALATALDLRDAGDQWLQFALLVYAALSPESTSQSYQQFGNGEFGLGVDAMNFFWSQYLAEESERNDPRAAPLLANMNDLPETYLISAGLDPLTDDSRCLEIALHSEGVPVTHRHYPGVVHGFFSMALFIDAGARAIEEAASAMKSALIQTEGAGQQRP